MRRAFVIVIAFLFLAVLVSAQNQTPAPATVPAFTLNPVGRNMWAAIDLNGHAGSNASFVIGDDGVAVIDTLEYPEAASALAEIRKKTSLPIKFVIDTHYHIDHVDGNRVFVEAGAIVMAHRNVRAWIHTENLKFFGGKDAKPEQKAMVEGLYAPDVVYDSGISLYLGSRVINVKFYPGHTGGDSLVSVSDEQGNDVVFCGDLFWRQSLPNLIDANTRLWIETLDSFTNPAPRQGTVFVPGHGDVGTAADVEAFRGYLSDLRAMVAGPVKEGKSGDELVAAVMPQLTEKYGQWGIFKHFSKRNILDVAAEIRGDKVVPQATATPN
jgi:glyoxylase-like metal-dependent hydrolase (beta-lactamase superfamily II)